MAACQRACSPAVRLCQKLNRLKTLEDDMMATSLKRCLNTLDLTLMGVGGMVGSGLMCVIVFVLVFGFILAEPANWSQQEGGFAPFGMSGILAGSATCFYAFVGFDVIASSSEEAKNPQKAVPIATAVSLGLAAVAYILVSTVLTLLVPWHTLDPDSALSDAFFRRGYSWAGIVVVVGSICAMNTVLLCNLYSLPRIVYAMAEDGLFFSFFARVNPVSKVPVNAIIVFGFIMAIIALIFDLQALVQFLSIGTLLAYTFVAASIIVLRFQPEKATIKTGTSSNANVDPSLARSESQTFKEESGELKQYESFSDKLQLVERTKATERRSVGQLRARWDPYLGRLVGDFEPGEVVAFCVLILLVSSVSLCAVVIFGSKPLELPLWSSSVLIVIFSLAFVISLALIWAHEPQRNTKTFQVPCVPLTPGVSILVNVFLMMKLSAMTWIRFAVWIGVGIVVYFGYGIWHSKEGKRELHAADMAARYVVLPSGSLVETVQSVQPEGQAEPSALSPAPTGDFQEKR
uniref:Cationic amino acid transporter C-terminal domain-containing protein n=1 Tax=Knipowitschia caucasica TaxID=637954 RepID=A0AAV2MSF3_KNICA